jgi:hypothetical protein
MTTQPKLLLPQFLEWVAAQPRSHRELRAAWSSTCPLTCAWEDAISDDLIAWRADGRLDLTERGRARLATR